MHLCHTTRRQTSSKCLPSFTSSTLLHALFHATIPDTLILFSRSSPWGFLLVLKEALTPLYIHDLVTEMAANQRLARIVISILQRHVQANSVHRVVIGFHMSVTAGYLSRIKLTDVHLAFILPCLIEGVTKTRIKDCVVRHDWRNHGCSPQR